MTAGSRVLLLVPARSYRVADFMLAATKMGLDLTVASDGALPVGGHPLIPVHPGDPGRAAERIVSLCGPVDAVIAADAPMLRVAASVASHLGLPHNPVGAVFAASDKTSQRRLWAGASVAQPRFEIVPAHASDDAVRRAAAAAGFPCVVKAVSLSAGQGVLRADDPGQAVRAAARIRRILSAVGQHADEPLLIEEYLPGPELSIDGLLGDDGLAPLAVFDKPATPGGPTFEETLLVTPSRLPRQVIARALGLRAGPVHAELRVTGTRTAMLELAARSIGGLCSRALRFPGGKSLEEMVLAHALGRPVPGHRDGRPSGVLMLPVPRPGMLRAVEGRSEAAAVPGITGLSITIPAGQQVRPLPDGDRYLGFVFAEGDTQDRVEQTLAAARERLRVVIDPAAPCETSGMTEHTHHHDEDSACAVAHGAVAPAAGAREPAGRTLVAVFASPVAGYLLRYGADLGFRGFLLEPDPGRAAGAAALGFPLLTAVPDDLDDTADVIVTDHHRPELGLMLRDALVTKARWIGSMGNPRNAAPHVQMLTGLGVAPDEIARVHRPIGLNIGSRTPPEIAVSALAGLLADRNGRSGGFEF